MAIDRQTAARAGKDVAVFAELVVGERLWPHQIEAARSKARIRCICSGRQAGKTRLLSIIALFTAFGRARRAGVGHLGW